MHYLHFWPLKKRNKWTKKVESELVPLKGWLELVRSSLASPVHNLHPIQLPLFAIYLHNLSYSVFDHSLHQYQVELLAEDFRKVLSPREHGNNSFRRYGILYNLFLHHFGLLRIVGISDSNTRWQSRWNRGRLILCHGSHYIFRGRRSQRR